MEVEVNEWMSHSDFLAHYGIPGMKWGRRKAKNSSTLGRYKKHKKDNSEIMSDQEWYGLSDKQYSEYKKKLNSLLKEGVPADDVSEIAYDHVVNPTTLDRYKKHRKTEKQYNEDLALYGKKGTKRIADDMDNKTTLKGARSKEAGKYNNAKKQVRNAEKTGRNVGSIAGTFTGYAGAAALRSLAKKVAKNGKLNSFGKIVANYPELLYAVSGAIGNAAGQGIGKQVGKRISARKNGYTYKDFKRRGV